MSTLLKLGLSGYDIKPRFGAFQCEYLLQNPLLFFGKHFGGTRHPYKKNEPTLDHSGVEEMHGKACWLIYPIMYKSFANYITTYQSYQYNNQYYTAALTSTCYSYN